MADRPIGSKLQLKNGIELDTLQAEAALHHLQSLYLMACKLRVADLTSEECNRFRDARMFLNNVIGDSRW